MIRVYLMCFCVCVCLWLCAHVTLFFFVYDAFFVVFFEHTENAETENCTVESKGEESRAVVGDVVQQLCRSEMCWVKYIQCYKGEVDACSDL